MATVTPLRRHRLYTGLSLSGLVRIDEQVYPCDVTDMSATGATLTFRLPVELPDDRFTLQLTSNGKVSRQCRVTWDEGVRVGVVFVFGARPG
jgi:hypothetical protein